MAEYKIYTCDVCGCRGAKRFTISKVDVIDDKVIDGYVDLCWDHIDPIMDVFFDVFDDSTVAQRRTIWKQLCKKG